LIIGDKIKKCNKVLDLEKMCITNILWIKHQN